MHYVIGGAVVLLGVIVAEIVLDYSLGDKVKDLFLSLFGKAKADIKAHL